LRRRMRPRAPLSADPCRLASRWWGWVLSSAGA
jgi:hypothetical protein